MKYCTKCGNPMADDMLFCQKCGTKSEVINASDTIINEKLASLYEYDICYKSLSWKALAKQPDLFKDYFGQRDYISQDLNNLIDEIKSLITDANKDIVLPKLYDFIFTTSHELLNYGTKLFKDTSERDEINHQLQSAFKAGQIKGDTCITIIKNVENAYKLIIICNFLYTKMLIDHIDRRDIFYSENYRKEIISLASEYQILFTAANVRMKDVGQLMGFEGSEKTIEYYFDILIGIRREDLNIIKDTEWEYHAKKLEDNDLKIDAQKFRQAIIDGRQRVLKASYEFEEEFWNNNPELKAEKEKLDASKKEIEDSCIPIKREIDEYEKLVDSNKSKIEKLKTEIDDKKASIDKLESKIFGKKKAIEEANNIRTELKKKEEALNTAKKELEATEESLSHFKNELQQKTTELSKIDNSISELLSK